MTLTQVTLRLQDLCTTTNTYTRLLGRATSEQRSTSKVASKVLLQILCDKKLLIDCP